MTTNSFPIPGQRGFGFDGVHFSEASVQSRLAVVLLLDVAAVAMSFSVENYLFPWRARMEVMTPGWCLILALASSLGVGATLAIRGGPLAIVQTLFVGTLLAYAYALAGWPQIDQNQSLQHAQLLFRALEVGMGALAAMSLGAGLRVVLHQRLVLNSECVEPSARQFNLAELMALTAVFGGVMALVNVFFDHYDREAQLVEVSISVVAAMTAALPWMWGVMQARLSAVSVAAIVGTALLVMATKATLAYALTGDELPAILLQAGHRAAAYASGAMVNGLVLRGLGFRWCRI